MSLEIIFLMSLVSVVSFLVVLSRIIGFRKVLQHATAVDISFTVVVCFVLAGSITGLLIGIVAGLIMTGILTVGRAFQRAKDAAEASLARKAKPFWEARPAAPAGRYDPYADPAMPHVDFGP